MCHNIVLYKLSNCTWLLKEYTFRCWIFFYVEWKWLEVGEQSECFLSVWGESGWKVCTIERGIDNHWNSWDVITCVRGMKVMWEDKRVCVNLYNYIQCNKLGKMHVHVNWMIENAWAGAYTHVWTFWEH